VKFSNHFSTTAICTEEQPFLHMDKKHNPLSSYQSGTGRTIGEMEAGQHNTSLQPQNWPSTALYPVDTGSDPDTKTCRTVIKLSELFTPDITPIPTFPPKTSLPARSTANASSNKRKHCTNCHKEHNIEDFFRKGKYWRSCNKYSQKTKSKRGARQRAAQRQQDAEARSNAGHRQRADRYTDIEACMYKEEAEETSMM
jgi:hypothetical protein